MDESSRLCRLVWPCEHGLLFLTSTDGPSDHSAMASEGGVVHALQGSLALAVRHYVDGDVTIDVWDGGIETPAGFVTVFDEHLSVEGRDLMITDTDNRVRLVFPTQGAPRVVVHAKGLPNIEHVVIEVHDD